MTRAVGKSPVKPKAVQTADRWAAPGPGHRLFQLKINQRRQEKYEMKAGSLKEAVLGYQPLICRWHQPKDQFKSDLLLPSEMLASLHPLEQL